MSIPKIPIPDRAPLPDGTTCRPDPARAMLLRDRYALRAWTADEMRDLSDGELRDAIRHYYYRPTPWREYTRDEIDTFSDLVREERRRAAASHGVQTPRRYGEDTLRTMDVRMGQRQAHAALLDVLSDDETDTGAYLYGDSGTGKTFLAAAWLRSMTAAGWRCALVSWPELLEHARRQMDGGEYEDLLSVALDTPAVVLDDLGVTGFSDYRIDVAHLVIDRRCGDRMPTVITSNLAPSALRESAGERLVTRLGELTPSVRVDL